MNLIQKYISYYIDFYEFDNNYNILQNYYFNIKYFNIFKALSIKTSYCSFIEIIILFIYLFL